MNRSEDNILRWRKIFLWAAVILFLTLAQAAYTFNSFSQIRFEELSESIRNVYYFHNHLVFSGINAHLGWYATLELIYRIFGFSLYTVKYFKLILYPISLLSLALLFGRYYNFKKILVPFLTIALSPSWLFFNTIANHYGIEFLYLPIVLYLLSIVKFKGNYFNLIPHILVGSFSMLAWLSYPSFIVFLPAIFLLYVYQLQKVKKKKLFIYGCLSLASFLIPLILLILQIDNKNLLISDPVTGGGIFRGAGEIRGVIFQRVVATFAGFGGLAQSYYYEVLNPDFSQYYSWISVIASFLISFILFLKKKISRVVYFSIASVFLTNILLILITSDPTESLSSVRRAGGILASIYAFYFISWVGIFNLKSRLKRIFLIAVLLLLPIHHFAVYFDNLNYLKVPSPNRESSWFISTKGPQDSLDSYLKVLKHQDLELLGVYQNKEDFGQMYNWIYTSLMSSCLWNDLICHGVLGYDKAKKGFVPLNLENINYTSETYQYRLK